MLAPTKWVGSCGWLGERCLTRGLWTLAEPVVDSDADAEWELVCLIAFDGL